VSKLLKLPFALLVALAMLVLWSGVASAEGEGEGEETVPSGTNCVMEDLLSECQPEQEPAPVQAVHPEDEPLDAGEAIPAFTGPQSLLEQQPLGTSSTDDEPTVEEQPAEQPPSEGDAPDPAVVGACISTEIQGLLTLLEGSLEGTASELAEDLQAALTDPLTLQAFLGTLPARIQTIPDLATELGEALPTAVEGIAACLPAPPATEEPEPTPPPVTQPVAQPAVYYANCDDARARGAAPVYAGQAGYDSHLDNDNDGVGCEQEVALATYTPTASPQLAYTGFEVEPFLVAGAALIALGTLTVIGAARRT
jgi:hypothetical protein